MLRIDKVVFGPNVTPVMRVTQILALTGVSLSLLGTTQADIETSFSAGYTSEYVYRGGFIADDLFDFCLLYTSPSPRDRG